MDLEICRRAVLLSDIDFVRWYAENRSLSAAARDFLSIELPLYDFSLSDDAYRAHYAFWEGKFYRGPVKGFLAKDWSLDPRFHQIYTAMFGMKVSQVFDFGCSAGHITRLLAEHFPAVEFTGYDIIPQALRLFNSLAPANARAVSECEGEYDLVLATEVLEHVPDPYQTLDRLAGMLTPGGRILLTMPNGPWEAQGYDDNPGGREHLRHWDADDLREVFEVVDSLSYVGCGMTKFGLPVGNVCCVAAGPSGRVNMERKLSTFYAVEPQAGFG